jgi:hypothetical protein
MKLRITLILAALTFPALSARAQQPPPAQPAQPAPAKQRFEVACSADIDKLCKAESQQNKTIECLAAHEKDLSEACSLGFMNGYRAAQICRPDFERLCKDAPKLGECVKQHDADLSKECKAALVKGSKKQKADEKAADKPTEKVAEKTPADKPAKSGKKAAKKK